MRKTIIALSVLGFGIAGLTEVSAPTPAGAQEVKGPKITWRMSLWGKRRAFTEGAETLSKRLAEETGGKFQLKIFYGGQLAKSRENWDGLKANSFEMATVCNFYHPKKNPALMVLTLPFLPLGNSFDRDAKIRQAVYDPPI